MSLAMLLCGLMSGCGWVAVALLSGGGGGGGGGGGANQASIPQVLTLSVQPTSGATRAVDLTDIRLTFQLIDANASPANLTVEFRQDSTMGFQPCSITTILADGMNTAPGDLMGLETLPGGVSYEMTWEAGTVLPDLATVDLRVTASNGEGQSIPALIQGLVVGNEPPITNNVTVDTEMTTANGTPIGSDFLIVRYELTDSSQDESNITLVFSLDGGATFIDVPDSQIVVGQTQGLLPDNPTGPITSLDVVWDTNYVATLPSGQTIDLARLDVQNLIVGIRATDNLGVNSVSQVAASAPFILANNNLPQATIFEPVFSDDGDGTINVRVVVTDTEADLTDVIVQWSNDRDAFPMLPPNIEEPFKRRQLLNDLDARKRLQVITPRLKTLARARVMKVVSQGVPNTQVFLTTATSQVPAASFAIRPDRVLGSFLQTRMIQSFLEVLSPAGGVLQRRRIQSVGVDNTTGLLSLTLALPLDTDIQIGQQLRIRESLEGVFQNLRSAANQGFVNSLAWDVAHDTGLGVGDSTYFLQVTPFSGARSGTSFRTGFAKPIATSSATFFSFDPASVLNGPPPSSASPRDLKFADFNRDGFLDCVANDLFTNGGPAQGRVVVYLGAKQENSADPLFNVTGRLGTVILTTPNDFSEVQVADFNGDGNTDVAALDVISNQLQISFGPDFVAANNLALPLTPGVNRFVVGEFNNDGQIDLAISNTNSQQVRVIFGDNNFTNFAALVAASAVIDVGARPVRLAVGEFSGDSHNDLAVTTTSVAGDPTLQIYHNDTMGDFSPFAEVELFLMGNSNALEVGDFNSDGRQDLAVLIQSAGVIEVFLNDELFQFFSFVDSVPTGPNPLSMAVLDVNNDGLDDLAAANNLGAMGGQLRLFVGDGTGAFLRPDGTEITVSGFQSPMNMAVGDLDNDGSDDLGMASPTMNSLFTVRNVCSNPLEVIAGQSLSPGRGPIHLLAVDVNNDGHQDLISANLLDDSISPFFGFGDGRFNEEANPVNVPLGDGPTDTVVADFNNDGFADFGVAQIASDSVIFLIGDAQFEFSTILNIDLGSGASPRALETGDFNEDGFADVVILASGFHQLIIGSNQGGTGFSTGTPIDLPLPSDSNFGENPYLLEVEDMNNDGHFDLVVALQSGNQVIIYHGLGDGSFDLQGAVALNVPGTGTPQSLALGDFNEDGRVDIATVNDAAGNVNELTVFNSTGVGTYQLWSFGRLVNPIVVRAGDIDDDGHLDLVIGDNGGGNAVGNLVVLRGDGDGKFEEGVPFSFDGISQPGGLVLADFNEDGALDVAISSFSQRFIVLRFNGQQKSVDVSVRGEERGDYPDLGMAPLGDLLFASRAEPYVINTDAGTIDGIVSFGMFPGGSAVRPGVKTFEFGNFEIQAGATVRVVGRSPFQLSATGTVKIDGVLDCSGAKAANVLALNFGTAGGRGGPGAANGGAGGGIAEGSRRREGLSGFGLGRGRAGVVDFAQTTPIPQTGGGAAFGTPGLIGPTQPASLAYLDPRLSFLMGGSGGAGGSVMPDVSPPMGPGPVSSLDFGGGGGGGGGGCVRITAQDVEINGSLLVNGGQGGTGFMGGTGMTAGHGGGGSGGSVLLQARSQITVGASAVITALGGLSGDPLAQPPSTDFSTGQGGRLRFEDFDQDVPLNGANVVPSPSIGAFVEPVSNAVGGGVDTIPGGNGN